MRVAAAVRSIVLALTVVLVVAAATPAWAASEPRTQPPVGVVVHACDEGAPDGFEVIENASGASEFNVLCNFLVTREKDDTTFVSGIAITVEYFCTAADAREAFEGKTGKRDTETFRSDTKVITEEGPAAKNKDNPQPDPIRGFGPEEYFLQEKSFELLTPQIVTTVVVLTNERGSFDEKERFGIAVAQPEVITVANNHLPTSCSVPAVGAKPGAKGSNGGGPGRVLVTTGIGGAIAIGGVTVWRRRKGRPFKRPPSGIDNVPPKCLGISKEFEQSRDVLLTTREAFQDMSDELLQAQKNHQNNIVKIHMIMGFEAGQIVGSTVGDLVQVLKPKVVHLGRSQVDTWKPPGGLDARMAAAFRSAMEVLERAAGKLGNLRNRVASLGSALGNISNHPLMVELRQQAEAALNAVRRGEQGLAASSAARTAIEGLDSNIETVSRAVAQNFKPIEALEANIERFRGFISQAEDEVVKLTRTVDGAHPGVPVDTKDVLAKRSQIESMQRQLNRDLAELGPLKMNHQDAMRNLDALMKRRDEMMSQLAKHGDVLPRDVEKLRAVHQQLMADMATKQTQLIGDLAAQYEAAQAQLKAAEIEHGLAEAYLKGLRAELERGGAAAQPGLARRVLHGTTSVLTFPLIPVMWLWEKGFGSVQSIPEAFEILMRGQRRITEMTHNVARVERAVEQTRRTTERLRSELQRCIDGAKALPTPAPGATLPPPSRGAA